MLQTLYALGDVIEQVPDEGWDKPTPCPGWTSREVLGHYLWATKNLTAAASLAAIT